MITRVGSGEVLATAQLSAPTPWREMRVLSGTVSAIREQVDAG